MILQSIKMALKSIKTNKLRSFLTMLGIIIGVFALVVLVSLVSGATSSITDSISGIGNDLISVNLFDWGEGTYRMSLKEVSALPEELEHVALVAPAAQGTVEAKTRMKGAGIQIYGTTAAYAEIQGYKMKYGRFLMNPDCENHTNVVVLNHETAIQFFGRDNCVGEYLKLDGRDYKVIGVIDSGKEQQSMMSMLLGGGMYTVYVPYTSLIRLVSNVKLSVDQFYASAVDGDTKAAQSELNDYLTEIYGDEDMFYIFSQSEISDAMDKVTSTLSLLLGGIAGISLLVGGIGIMNIMLVSVTERTKEIGIRKAIGAQPSAIRLQFLIEAITLSIVGCITGIILSWIVIEVINIIGNVSFGLSIPVIIVSVLFSSGVGVLFGLYPAHKASKMKPIDALRFS